MAVLTPEEFEQLTNIAKSASHDADLRVLDAHISEGERVDEIENLRVQVTLDVPDDQEWDTDRAAAIRREIHVAVASELTRTRPNASYAISTFLRPRSTVAARDDR